MWLLTIMFVPVFVWVWGVPWAVQMESPPGVHPYDPYKYTYIYILWWGGPTSVLFASKDIIYLDTIILIIVLLFCEGGEVTHGRLNAVPIPMVGAASIHSDQYHS